MIQTVFFSLPVADVARATAFFEGLGFARKPEMSDETGTCIEIADSVYAMLLSHAKFLEFSPKPVCDTAQSAEVLFSLACDTRERVDEIVAAALAQGGSTVEEPQDYGFMYHHGFVDLDGHHWGLIHMSGPMPQG